MASSDSEDTVYSRASSPDYRVSFIDKLKAAQHRTRADRRRLLRLVAVCTSILLLAVVVVYLSHRRAWTGSANENGVKTQLPLDIAFQRAPSIEGLPPGDLLHEKNRIVASADRSHFLRLQHDGNLVLYRFMQTGTGYNVTEELWSLGCGNVERDTTNVVRLSEDGLLSVVQIFQKSRRSKRSDSKSGNEERVIWHSNLIPECKNPPEVVQGHASDRPRLNIGSNGDLVITGRCKLYSPPPKTAGKLAVLVSGLYRTNMWVCGSHVHYLAKNPSADSVDIFAYILYEEGDLRNEMTPEVLETRIRECYGHYLKKLTLKLAEDVEEEFPDKVDENCGRMHRLQSQLKTMYLSGLDWWQWSVTNGVKHDTVLRVRTDHEFHGGDKPKFKPVDQLKGNELVLTPLAGGSHVPQIQHWFCSNPYGRMDVAPSDQLAYGTRTAMRFYLMMYQDFRWIISMSVPKNKSFRGNWLCLGTPTGPGDDECEHAEFCTIECSLSWYLQSWGIEMSIEWGWEFFIKR